MTDHEFDRLLETACIRENQAETAAAGLTVRRPGRPLRTVLIAAVCAALLALGVAAAWPRLELARTGRDTFSLKAEDTGETAPAVTGIEVSGLPEGYAIVESRSDPGDRWAAVTISTPDPDAELTVIKYALDCRQGYKIEKVGGTVPADLDPVERVMAEYVVLDSPDDLTPEALQEGSTVVYPAADCYYEASYVGVDPEDVCAILQNLR